MVKKVSIVSCLLTCVFVLSAQVSDYDGPVNTALGHTRVFDESVWAGLNNVSNLAHHSHLSLGAGYQLRFNMTELSTRAAVLTWPTQYGVFSGLVLQSGYSKSNITRAGVSYSRLFGDFLAAGLQFNYLTHQVQGARSGNAVYTSAGLLFSITPNLDGGIFVHNPEQGKLNYGDERYALPTFFNAACRFQPSSRIMLVLEVEKDLDNDVAYKLGLQLGFLDRLFVRGGINAQPVEMTFGGGYELGGLSIDVGFAHHQQLGLTSGAGISYRFNKKR
ncbi:MULTISPECIES: hypothetical protein [unclassified Carboxylicivirga]|uniref:hypothetical protein n=1 Tax=Carboxylicivirga TaxID=1628153 RepID=UPI003D34209C